MKVFSFLGVLWALIRAVCGAAGLEDKGLARVRHGFSGFTQSEIQECRKGNAQSGFGWCALRQASLLLTVAVVGASNLGAQSTTLALAPSGSAFWGVQRPMTTPVSTFYNVLVTPVGPGYTTMTVELYNAAGTTSLSASVTMTMGDFVTTGQTVGGSGPVIFTSGSDVIELQLGDASSDWIEASTSSGANFTMIWALAGDDSIYGYLAADNLFGGTGEDYIVGDEDNDHLEGGTEIDTIYGGLDGSGVDSNFTSDDDYLHGGDDGDYLYGSGGNDALLGWDGEDELYGGNGDDFIQAGDHDDLVYGGSGFDLIWGDGGPTFSPGDDIVYGGDDADAVYADGPNPFLPGPSAGTQADLIYGEGGDDYLEGGNGSDEIYGGDGDDEIYGSNSSFLVGATTDADTLVGGAGRDDIYGGLGVDRMEGGSGDDRLWGNGGDDTLLGEVGDDALDGGAGADRLEGGDGTDYLEDLDSTSGDELYGQGGDDLLFSLDTSTSPGDTLDGGSGTNSIWWNNVDSASNGTSNPTLPSGYDTMLTGFARFSDFASWSWTAMSSTATDDFWGSAGPAGPRSA